ncbi:hypothetical protein CsSME_00022875 [Camellia sinensis var. sinensis]
MESLAPCDETESYILSKKTVHEARCLFMHVFPYFIKDDKTSSRSCFHHY